MIQFHNLITPKLKVVLLLTFSTAMNNCENLIVFITDDLYNRFHFISYIVHVVAVLSAQITRSLISEQIAALCLELFDFIKQGFGIHFQILGKTVKAIISFYISIQ